MDEKINFKPHTTHMLAHKAESDVVRISYRNQRTLPMWLTVVPPTNHPNDTITHPYIYIHTLTLRQRIQPKLFALHNLLANGNNIMSHLCPKPPSLFNKKNDANERIGFKLYIPAIHYAGCSQQQLFK